MAIDLIAAARNLKINAKSLISITVIAGTLHGCSLADRFVYKLDIPQGNEVTADAVARLKPGMTRSQVKFLLGTPLLADPFHANRWDYVYRDSKAGELKDQKRFVVFFEGDKLSRFEGETLPARKTDSSDLIPVESKP